MKPFKTIITGVTLSLVITGCVSQGDDPGVEYAPEMYVSKGYEPMSQLADQKRTIEFQGEEFEINKDGKTMREPVEGTVARGKVDFYFPYEPNSQDEKDRAGRDLKNPVPLTQVALENGRKYYNINCLPCHGNKGLGDGAVAAKYPKNYIPSYKTDRIISMADGALYYSITHGWNFMGGYGTVLNPTQRWEVVHYVNYLEKN